MFGGWVEITNKNQSACNKMILLKSALHQSMNKICSFELPTLPLPLPCSHARCQTTQLSGGMQIADALSLNFWHNHSALQVIKTAFQITNIFPAPEQYFLSAAFFHHVPSAPAVENWTVWICGMCIFCRRQSHFSHLARCASAACK